MNHRSISLMGLIGLLAVNAAGAGSATWSSTPGTGDWNTAGNWTPTTVPNGAGDTATFATSSQTAVSISADTTVNGIAFPAGADAFSITVLPAGACCGFGNILTVSGSGISNESGRDQRFVLRRTFREGVPAIDFTGSATAGRRTFFNINNGGQVTFRDSSNAGRATLTCNNSSIDFQNNSSAGNATINCNLQGDRLTFSSVVFNDQSTASNATITLNPGPPTPTGSSGAAAGFGAGSTAGNATIVARGADVANGGSGQIVFQKGSTAGHAFLTAAASSPVNIGGQIFFVRGSDGGFARAAIFGNGRLDIRNFTLRTKTGSLTIGSIEGDGLVYLGAAKLVTGSNDLDTTFDGVIGDQPPPGTGKTGGSLQKIGHGALTLTNANTYTGSTILSRGMLLVNNATGSGTGPGPVQVNAGILGGVGEIGGTVAIGTGAGHAAILSPGPGPGQPGALKVDSAVTFNSLSNYQCILNRNTGKISKLTALGMSIGDNVTFALRNNNTGALAPGTVFVVINNVSTQPIFGHFGNLPDGSTFSSGGNSFKANYEGGDGNDLTLAVQ